MVSVFFRHENIRKGQKELMQDIITAVSQGKHLIAHAPTGLGKTDSSISASLAYALENDKTIFFCTPKISQHRTAVDVMKGLVEKYDLKAVTLDVIGKKHLCLDEIREKETDGFYELCKKKRMKRSCYYYDRIRGYGLKQKASAKIRAEALRDWYGSVRTHEELLSYCEREELCPYEASLIIGEQADVIICDYYHVLNPFIGDSFLAKTNKNLEDAIVIIDEAHNAAERLRNAMSSSLNISMVRKARNEAILAGARELEKRLHRIEKELNLMAENMKEEEQERVMHKSELPLFSSDFFEELYEVGMFVLETTNLNKSHCLKILSFYENWVNNSEAFIRIFKKTKRGYSAVVKCLDASIITADRLNATHSTILMSGTLKPGEMYRDLLGLDKNRTMIREYASPFPKHNKLNILVKGVTTKYENRTMEEFVKIASMIREITDNIPGNSAVFFPSYSMMREVMPFLKTEKKVIIQEENQSPEKTRKALEEFKSLSGEGGILVGVSGGSFAEGIDFPGNDLLGVVIVGVPLKEPDIETRALIRYYDMKFGKGWDYGYVLPAMSKAVQAAGRVIRNEQDKGVVVFLDTRFSWQKYAKCLPSGEDFVVTEKPGLEVKKFWLR